MAVLSPSERLQQAPERSNLARWLGRDYAIAWPFLTPLLAVLIGLIAYPFGTALWLSMNRKMVGADAIFIGPGNFHALLFSDQYSALFRRTVWVSFVFVAASISLKFILGMCMALLLNERFRGRTIMRAILFIPWAMPTLIVALAWRWIYEGSPSGLINMILIQWFKSDTIIQFLANPKLALWSVIFAAIWQGTPFWTIMFLAGMQGTEHQPANYLHKGLPTALSLCRETGTPLVVGPDGPAGPARPRSPGLPLGPTEPVHAAA